MGKSGGGAERSWGDPAEAPREKRLCASKAFEL